MSDGDRRREFASLDSPIYVVHNHWVKLRFTKSARLHKVGRARAVFAIEHAYAVVCVDRPAGAGYLLMYLGDDETGRAFEVGGIEEGDTFVVIHVMDLRTKFRTAYETGKAQGATE